VNTITENFTAWSYAGGKVIAGLLRRRREEANMFFGSGNELEDEDLIDTAVLIFTKEDYWAGYDVCVKNNNCALFIRYSDKSVPKDAKNTKKLYVIGGSSTGLPQEILLSGKTKYDTAQEVAKYLAI